jgi:hypothetical protein
VILYRQRASEVLFFRIALCEEIFCHLDKLDIVDESFVQQVENIRKALNTLGTSGEQSVLETSRNIQVEDLRARLNDADIRLGSDGNSRLSFDFLDLLSICLLYFQSRKIYCQNTGKPALIPVFYS